MAKGSVELDPGGHHFRRRLARRPQRPPTRPADEQKLAVAELMAPEWKVGLDEAPSLEDDVERDRILREGPCPRTDVLIREEDTPEPQLLERSCQRVGGRSHAGLTSKNRAWRPERLARVSRNNLERWPFVRDRVTIRNVPSGYPEARSGSVRNGRVGERSRRRPARSFRYPGVRSGVILERLNDRKPTEELPSHFACARHIRAAEQVGRSTRGPRHRPRRSKMTLQAALRNRMERSRGPCDLTPAGPYQVGSAGSLGKPDGTFCRVTRAHAKADRSKRFPIGLWETTSRVSRCMTYKA